MRALSLISLLILSCLSLTVTAAPRSNDLSDYGFEEAINEFEKILQRQVKRRRADRFDLSYTLPNGNKITATINSPSELQPLLMNIPGGEYNFYVEYYRSGSKYRSRIVKLEIPNTAPTLEPTQELTPEPTPEPTPQPKLEPTPEPTPVPTPEPKPEPTPEPTPVPTPEPTPAPLPAPPTTVTLSWSIPSTRENSEPLPLSEIGGYEIYVVGNTASNQAIDEVVEISDAQQSNYAFQNLLAGEYNFAMATVDSEGLKSQTSEIVSITVQ